MPDPTGPELLTGLDLAVLVRLVLVDVGGDDERVADSENRVYARSAVALNITMSWNVGSSLVKTPSVSLRKCSTPTRA